MIVSVIGWSLFIGFYIFLTIHDTREHHVRKEYLLDKSRELYMKGEVEKADQYTQAACSIKTLY